MNFFHLYLDLASLINNLLSITGLLPSTIWEYLLNASLIQISSKLLPSSLYRLSKSLQIIKALSAGVNFSISDSNDFRFIKVSLFPTNIKEGSNVYNHKIVSHQKSIKQMTCNKILRVENEVEPDELLPFPE